MRTYGHREGSITHWGLLGGNRGGTAAGDWGGITLGEIPDVGDGGMEAANHPCHVWYLWNNSAGSAHVPQNLKYNLKNNKNKFHV